MIKRKKEEYIEKYEKNLILFGLFAFIIIGVIFLMFVLPYIYGFYDNINPGNKSSSSQSQNLLDPETNYKYGIESLARNNYSSALKYFEEAVKTEPDNVNYLTELAVTNYRLKNYDDAIRTYERILELDPDNVSCYNRIGNIYWLKKDLGQAETSFRKAIELDPTLIVGYNNLALMLDENGNKEEALEVINEGIEKNPDNVELKYYLKIIGG